MSGIQSIEQGDWLDQHFPRKPYSVKFKKFEFDFMLNHMQYIIDGGDCADEDFRNKAKKLFDKISKYYVVKENKISVKLFPSDLRIFLDLYLAGLSSIVVPFVTNPEKRKYTQHYFDIFNSAYDGRHNQNDFDYENIKPDISNEEKQSVFVNILFATNSNDREKNPVSFHVKGFSINADGFINSFVVSNDDGYSYDVVLYDSSENKDETSWLIMKHKGHYRSYKRLYTRKFFLDKYMKSEGLDKDSYAELFGKIKNAEGVQKVILNNGDKR